MNELDRKDEALGKLLRAAQAEPDPVLWTRVRARLAADDQVPGVIAWLMRPAALVASIATLALASILSLQLVNDIVPQTLASATGLTDALIGIERSPVEGLVTAAEAAAEAETPADSGVAP